MRQFGLGLRRQVLVSSLVHVSTCESEVKRRMGTLTVTRRKVVLHCVKDFLLDGRHDVREMVV